MRSPQVPPREPSPEYAHRWAAMAKMANTFDKVRAWRELEKMQADKTMQAKSAALVKKLEEKYDEAMAQLRVKELALEEKSDSQERMILQQMETFDFQNLHDDSDAYSEGEAAGYNKGYNTGRQEERKAWMRKEVATQKQLQDVFNQMSEVREMMDGHFSEQGEFGTISFNL